MSVTVIEHVPARLKAIGISEVFGVAYAEHLPVFHLGGMPNMPTQAGRALMDHTLGNGESDLFRKMSEPVVCASAIMTPQNVASETERLIAGGALSSPASLYGLSRGSREPDGARQSTAVGSAEERLHNAPVGD